MYTTLTTLINHLDSSAISKTNVIRWGSPVPAFGNLANAQVATLGLNPSNREFVDESGEELQGPARRFHTLRSLGLNSWSEVDARHLNIMLEACHQYFLGNPYDRWFRKLNYVVAGTQASFYDATACHLDLIPYATACKWTELTWQQRSSLLTIAGDTLALLLRDSPVHTLILNGNAVVQQFQDIANVKLEKEEMPTWSLPRQTKPHVTGIAYRGVVDTLSGISLGHGILVLGYNHNLQSSFGVTTEVVNAIRDWIAQETRQ